MPNPNDPNQPSDKPPVKMDELANYLLTEAEREGANPDKATREQLSLLLTEAASKRSPKTKAKKKTKKTHTSRRKTKSRPKAKPRRALKSGAKAASARRSRSRKTRRKRA